MLVELHHTAQGNDSPSGCKAAEDKRVAHCKHHPHSTSRCTQTNKYTHSHMRVQAHIHPYTLLIHILTHTHTQMTKRSQCKSTWECMYMCAEFSTAPTWLCTATVDGLSAYLLARWPLVSPSQAQQGTQDHLRTVFHLSRSRGGEGLEKE